ncbi:hypothetical protein Tco_0534197 [Tanacetum coccineum]
MALNRSKSRYSIKECSTCGSWYTKECCSIGNLKDQIIVPVSDSFQHCAVCGTPVDGPYCHGCTLIRTKFEKDLFAYCVDNGVFQNFQDTPESSNDNTNVVNAPREPSVVDQDPGVNISQDPPQIDHNLASMEMLTNAQAYLQNLCKALDEYESHHIPHNEKSIKLLLAEEKFLKIKQVVEEEQTPPEYLQALLQSLLEDLQILNEIQQLKQEIPNQIQKDQRKKIEDMSIEEMMHAQQLVDREIKEIINDLGYKRCRGEEIDEEYERDCEIKIRKLKQDFNIWGSEVRKKEKAYEDEKYAAACRYMLSVTCDDDDDDNLGFYAVHPNTIHTPVSQNVEPKDSLIMGDGHINTIPETETISVETLVSNPSESDDFSLGECNLFNIDDSYYEKSTSRLDHLAPISPEIVEVCVDNDDTDDDDDCDMPVCDESSPIFTIFSNPLFDSNENFSSDDESLFEEEIQKDEFNSFSNPLYDIDDEIITNESYSLSRKDLDETILIPPGIAEPCFNAESDLLESLLNRDSPIDSTKTDSIFDEFSFPRLPEEHNSENVDTIIESLSYSPIPIEDSDSFIEEVDLFLTSDDSMPPGIESDDYDSEGDFRFLEELLINDSLPLPENESYNLNSVDNPESPVVKSCFDYEPVVAMTNDFDVLNDVESFDSGEGENVDSLNVEEEDSFTFTIRSFLPFVTYPEVLPVSYSTGSEDKVFNPGIFDKNASNDKSSKELAPSKALLTLDVFDPLHPPLMDFHVLPGFGASWFNIVEDKQFPTFPSRFLQFPLIIERIEKTKRHKRSNDKKREKDKESRARQRNQPKITAGSARHSQTQSKKEIKEVKSQITSQRAKVVKCSKIKELM